MLQLYLPDIQPEDGHSALFELLHGAPFAVSFTVPAACINNIPVAAGFKQRLISVTSLDDLTHITDVQAFTGISFSVNSENWRYLPDLVRFCRESGVLKLVLPMQRLYTDEIPFFITRQEQQELGTALVETGGVKDLNITIHDPFLWRAFNPAIPFPQAGCQAANTMVFIDPDGNVYPCPTLPVHLGTIGDVSLKEILASPAKKEFRCKLLASPEDCRECGEVSVCRGGCRGRALVMHGSLDGIDVACK